MEKNTAKRELLRLPKFADKGAAFRHYAKHVKGVIIGKNGKLITKAGGADMPLYKSLEEYISGAQQFFNKTGNDILIKFRSNGELLKFDRSTGFFGAQAKDGTIKTFFHPDEGVNYFLNQ